MMRMTKKSENDGEITSCGSIRLTLVFCGGKRKSLLAYATRRRLPCAHLESIFQPSICLVVALIHFHSFI